MWSGLRQQLVAAGAAGVAVACALVLAGEALRAPRDSGWASVSAGLGLGARTGVAGGFFAYDARLETHPDGAFAPFPGAALGTGPGGVLDTPAPERGGARGR